MADNLILDVQGTILDDCTHENIDFQGCSCLDCGVVFKDSSQLIAPRNGKNYDESRMTINKKKRECSLWTKKERDTLEFSPNIIDKAEEISSKFAIQVEYNRRTRRKMRRFVCLMLAHQELGELVDDKDIATKIDMEHKYISEALSRFSPLQTKYISKSKNKRKHPIVIVAMTRLKKLGLEGDAFARIERIIMHAIKVDPSIKNKHNAATSASAAVLFYLEISNHKIDQSKIDKVITVSSVTLKTVRDKIAEAYNKRLPKK